MYAPKKSPAENKRKTCDVKGKRSLQPRFNATAFEESIEENSEAVSLTDHPLIQRLRAESTPQPIQAKLKVGPANDAFEREADAMADKAMRMPEPAANQGSVAANGPLAANGAPSVQRMCESCEEEEEIKRSEEVETLQPKLQTSHLAPTAMQDLDAGLQRKCSTCEEEEESSSPEEAAEDSTLQLKALASSGAPPGDPNKGAGTGLSKDFSSRLQQSRGYGASLDPSTQSFMESRFAADFSGVRIHDDSQSHSLAKEISAKAFTLGSDIYFAQGQYQPSSHSGKHLLAHELTHTLQQGAASHVRRAPADTIQRDIDPQQTQDDSAEDLLAELRDGSLNSSLQVEERIRRLHWRERKELRQSLEQSNRGLPNEVANDVREVLANIRAGYVGATGGAGPQSRPCEAGDVTKVSTQEWQDNPTITMLELLEGDGVGGKLSRTSPKDAILLTQKALVQWGCEVASPARNPLPKYGADGDLGTETKRGIKQFQKEQGLKANGQAGPETIKALGTKVVGSNLRREVEAEEVQQERSEQAEAKQQEINKIESREKQIGSLIEFLYAQKNRYQGDDREQYRVNTSYLVAEKIKGHGPEIIGEALERILLQDPDFYRQLLSGGKLIRALQDFDVYGVEFEPPTGDTGFLDGFVLELNTLQHTSPIKNREFEGWDYAEVYGGLVVGSHIGLAKGLAETLTTVWDLFTGKLLDDFMSLINEVLPRVIEEPRFRFQLGQGAAELFYKQATELKQSSPFDYGKQIGTWFGMMVFEIVLGILTAGAATSLKTLKTADLAANFPKLAKVAKAIASTGVGRVGINVAKVIAKATAQTVGNARDIIKRARRLLPDLTPDAKIGRQLDEFEVIDQKFLLSKIEALEFQDKKLELALKQADEHPELVEKLSDELRKQADELEGLLRRHDPNHGSSSGKIGSNNRLHSRAELEADPDFMSRLRTSGKKAGADLSPRELLDEIRWGFSDPDVKAGNKPRFDVSDEHHWEGEGHKKFCRFSETPDPCTEIVDHGDGTVSHRQVQESTGERGKLEEGGDVAAATSRSQILSRLDEVIRPFLKEAFNVLPADAKIGFRGSLAKGVKGAHKGFAPFDPTKFDIDIFIVSDSLRNPRMRFQVPPRPLRQIAKEIDAALREFPEFAGMKSGKDRLQFRVWSETELAKKRKNGDVQRFFNRDGD